MKRGAERGLAVLATGVAALAACAPPRDPAPATALRLARADSPPFARAESPRPFRLPEDHGPHYEYQTEWWYYTGQLHTAAGRRFGFQLTFFRRGLTPGAPPAGATLATNQLYLAHFAVTDVAGERHTFFERLARGAGGLAGARSSPYAAWLEDWRVDALDPAGSQVRLSARERGLALQLDLAARKPLVAHGDGGLSPKSGQRGNASYYVGYTRLAARGTLDLDGVRHAVSGQAWFDHEWSTSALSDAAVGWDWFSLQLSDGAELMSFRIRRQDGSVEPASGGTWVEVDGSTRRLHAHDVALEPRARWTSPESGATYPSGWRLRVPALALEVRVLPLLAAQEIRASFTYWEGAVTVSGTRAGRALTGQGYVELTGYAGSLRGAF